MGGIFIQTTVLFRTTSLVFVFTHWLMAMGERPLSQENRLVLRAMLSGERFTEGGDGYPLLFQSGETWKGKPLVDRQHPHDLFMELAGTLSHSYGGEKSAFLYLGYPGEPALGPTAYMHRPSAQFLPDAVLGHHNQDATHIAFGVATLGALWGRFKIDGSIFTGREPDEERLDFDQPRFDSYSLRLEIRPSPYLSAQVSGGFLNSPEIVRPDENLARFTASAIVSLPMGSKGNFASSLVYGANLGLNGSQDDLEGNRVSCPPPWRPS